MCVQAGWNRWRKKSSVMCDDRLSAQMKGKVYKTMVRPADILYFRDCGTEEKTESRVENSSD